MINGLDWYSRHMTDDDGHDAPQRRLSRRTLLIGAAGGLGAAFVLREHMPWWDDDAATDRPAPRSAAPSTSPSRGAAAGIEPKLHTRAQWDARPPRRPIKVLDVPPKKIVVHHTATPNVSDRSADQAYRLSRNIQNFHMDERGWEDMGEQLTISRGGHVVEGRHRTIEAVRSGRHPVGDQTMPTPEHNRWTFAIENEGDYMTARVPAVLWESLVGTCAWLCRAYDLDPATAIAGHRDFISTSCPGDRLYARLPELRTEVARLLTRPG